MLKISRADSSKKFKKLFRRWVFTFEFDPSKINFLMFTISLKFFLVPFIKNHVLFVFFSRCCLLKIKKKLLLGFLNCYLSFQFTYFQEENSLFYLKELVVIVQVILQLLWNLILPSSIQTICVCLIWFVRGV